ncbi:MAG: hypothetical protein V3V92_02525, partial [Candidatus Hydrothermarchaeales archaeon]
MENNNQLEERQIEGKRDWGPKTAKDYHEKIAYMFAAGMRNPEIMEVTGFSENYVSILRNSPLMREIIDRIKKHIHEGYRGSIVDEFSDFVSEAVRELKELVRHGEGNVKLGAIKEWLDRSPEVPRKTQYIEQEQKVTFVFDTDKVESIQKTAQEAGVRLIQDVTPNRPRLPEAQIDQARSIA